MTHAARCLAAAAALLHAAAARPASAATYEFVATDEVFLNPERGLYRHAPMVGRTSFARLRRSGVSLVYAQIYLAEFRDRRLSDQRLAEISDAFGRLRQAGLKGIVRVSYSNRIDEPDASLSQVEEHLRQLAPIFQQNQDVIAFFQAGVIGAWGEWHASTNQLDTPQGRRQVMNLLLKHLPAERFIQVRTPMFKWELFDDPVSSDTAFTFTGAARVGHHNDCFLASQTDAGTYPQREIELWKGRLAEDTRYVPIGGETCRESRFTNCQVAQRELERMHWTYLNRDYHRGVIRELEPCWQTITNRLGYRYELLDCELPDLVSAGQTLSYSIRLRNVGYAPMYNRRGVQLRVFASDKVETVVATAEVPSSDPRRWAPGQTVQLKGTLQLPDPLPHQSVGVALWLPDASAQLRQRPEYSVRCANRDVWDAEAGHNVLAPDVPVR